VGRRNRQNDLFQFDAKAYHKDLRIALTRATRKARDELLARVKAEAEKLPFKDNKVRLTDGTETSDAKRKQALINSIQATKKVARIEGSLARKLYMLPIGWKLEETAITAEVHAMREGDYRLTHIGNYYEYGTGEKEDVTSLKKVGIYMGDANKFRPPKSGKPVKSRPEGLWRDMGGNLRRSYGKGGVGRENKQFDKYIGEDIEAYHWFRKAYEEMEPRVIEIYREAVNSFLANFRKYFKVNKRFVLGGRR
jgi:hypothetical protein